MSATLQRRRRLGAVAALGVLLVAALAVEAVTQGARSGVLAEARDVFVSSARHERSDGEAGNGGVEGGEAASDLAGEVRLDDPARSQVSMLPDGFVDEVLPLEGFADVRVGADGSVVGFSLSEGPSEAFAFLQKALTDRGWKAAPAGNGTSGTFIKEQGRFTWLFASCIGVGDTTSAVVQCTGAEGKD